MESNQTFFKLNESNVIDNTIVVQCDDEKSGIEYIKNVLKLSGEWAIQTDPIKQAVGATFDAQLNIYIPPKPRDVDWLIYSPEFEQWIPDVPFPVDAYYVQGYGPQPEYKLVETLKLDDGSEISRYDIDLPDDKNVYTWNEDELNWTLLPKKPANFTPPPIEEVHAQFMLMKQMANEASNSDTI